MTSMNTPDARRGAISYGLGNLGTNIYSQAFATFILFFYVDHLRAPLGPITLAMSIQSVWHAVLNPMTGLLSDRTRSRWGRRIPYIAAGFLPLGVVFWLLWHPLVSRGHGLVLYFLVVVALFDALYLLVVINWTSLFPERFRTLKVRSEVARWRQGFGILALMIGVSLPPVLYGQFGWSSMGAILAGVGTFGYFAVVLGHQTAVAESPPPPSREPLWRPFWAVLREPGFLRYLGMNFLVQFVLVLIPAALPFLAKYVLHLGHSQLSVMLGTAFIVAILTVYPWSRLIQRWGAHRALLTAVGIMTLASLGFFVVGGFLTGVLTTIVLGMGLGGFLMLIDIVMAEIIDQHAQSHGLRREGAFYGVNGFVLRFGTTLEALLVYLVFHFTGYHANAAGLASPLVRDGLRILTAGIPAVALLAALALFRRPIRS